MLFLGWILLFNFNATTVLDLAKHVLQLKPVTLSCGLVTDDSTTEKLKARTKNTIVLFCMRVRLEGYLAYSCPQQCPKPDAQGKCIRSWACTLRYFLDVLSSFVSANNGRATFVFCIIFVIYLHCLWRFNNIMGILNVSELLVFYSAQIRLHMLSALSMLNLSFRFPVTKLSFFFFWNFQPS